MSLYAIGDLHLSIGGSKPMDVFGDAWIGHVEKLRDGFRQISKDDVVILCGDLSWAMSLPEAVCDFSFLSEMPGKKILLKGNHDYWWQTAKKMNLWFEEHGWNDFYILHNNAMLYDDGKGGVALCGTRGWFFEEDGNALNDKIYKRELLRLEASLKYGKTLDTARIFVFLHYPPLFGNGYECKEITELLREYHVERCYYGHLHGQSTRLAVQGKHNCVDYTLVSADSIGFSPIKIL